MSLTLRHRIFLTLAPLLALMLVLGGAGVALLHRVGGRIDAILRENYESVIAMERLNEALERIDSSFQFALGRRSDKAQRQYQQNWKQYQDALRMEADNITLPGEQELFDELSRLSASYRRQGDAFFNLPDASVERQRAYFGKRRLLDTFQDIKTTSTKILRINQENMESASREARLTVRESLFWFVAGLATATLLAGLLAWHTLQTILRPVRAMTQSALAIGQGNLDQVVPILARDELGELADAFNKMARQLRHYRQTDYARLLRAQRTSQATVDSFPDPVLVVDSEGQTELANPAATRLFGVIGRNGAAAAGPPWQPPPTLREPLTEALRSQRSFLPQGFDQVMAIQMNGRELFFLPRILPIQDPYGNILGAAVLLQDVTRFHLLDELKSDLVATVSHELKTPLTSIRLALHLLLEETIGPLTPKQTELLLDARDNAERLLARVNSLLDLAKLEQKRERLDLFAESPAELLRAAAERVRPRAEDKQIAVRVESAADLPAIAVDAQRLGYALDNLLDNALTYTEPGGQIALQATAANGQITLTVADTGIGIPSEALPHVFEKFFRVPGQTRGGGTGLGLAIVREIVIAQGGTVTCESRPGEGAAFHLTLPATDQPRQGDKETE